MYAFIIGKENNLEVVGVMAVHLIRQKRRRRLSLPISLLVNTIETQSSILISLHSPLRR